MLSKNKMRQYEFNAGEFIMSDSIVGAARLDRTKGKAGLRRVFRDQHRGGSTHLFYEGVTLQLKQRIALCDDLAAHHVSTERYS